MVVTKESVIDELTALLDEAEAAQEDDRREIEDLRKRLVAMSHIAREYLHRFGYLMDQAGSEPYMEVMAVESFIRELLGGKAVHR